MIVNLKKQIVKSFQKNIFFLSGNLGNELEVTGNVRNLSPTLWTLSHLTALYLNDNQLTRLPSEIACLNHLVTLDLSNNKLRNLPSEIGMLKRFKRALKIMTKKSPFFVKAHWVFLSLTTYVIVLFYTCHIFILIDR